MRIGQPLILAAVLGCVSCTRPTTLPYTAVVSDPALSAAGPVVLSVRSATGRVTDFTRADLAGLGLVTYTTPDPSRKNQLHRYVGPLLDSVLKTAGIADDATLHLIARDRYTFDLDLAQIRHVPAMLALKSDGHVLELRDYGPVYLTFPYHAYRLDQNLFNGAWVWQLFRIEERPAAH